MSSDPGREAGGTPSTFTRGGNAEETTALPVSTVFDVLSDRHRRHLLYYLIDDVGGTATASEIAEHICAVEPGPRAVDPESVIVELRHRHLPRLSDAGLVEYEDRGEASEKREEAHEGRDEEVRYLGDPLVEECLARVAVRDFGRQP